MTPLENPPAIARTVHGTLRGEPVALFTLTSPSGLVARISELGATIVELHVPDASGALADVVLGFDDFERYAEPGHYFGCIVGRVANRIALGRFTLDGAEHALTINHGRHHLHGGAFGFARAIWRAEPAAAFAATGPPSLRLRYRSADGEDGYPGALDATVEYTLTDRAELRMEFSATTDRATLVNLSQHTYWNLAGHDSGDILDHRLEVLASRYTPADPERIPTGAIDPVEGGPFDFRRERRIGTAVAELAASREGVTSGSPDGYDVNFVIDSESATLCHAATLRDPRGGRGMEVWTTEPGLQLYTGNHLDRIAGKRGATYGHHAGLCLETQRFPDAIHHAGEPGWPTVVLRPGEVYRHLTLHRFLTR